ncbi:MAG: hypothetical protein SCL54_04630, partial [Bacillota bacterium]|nr:hypothetical protein [Bacillota bacterium]
INHTLAVIANRKIDAGHSIKFEKSHFKPIDDRGLPVYYHKGTSVIVIKAFDGNILASINDKVYELDLIPTHELKSRYFDSPNKLTNLPVKRNIPPMIHPWKKSALNKFMKKHFTQYDYTYEDIINTQEIIKDFI